MCPLAINDKGKCGAAYEVLGFYDSQKDRTIARLPKYTMPLNCYKKPVVIKIFIKRVAVDCSFRMGRCEHAIRQRKTMFSVINSNIIPDFDKCHLSPSLIILGRYTSPV